MTDQLTNEILPKQLVAILKEDGYRDYENTAYDFYVTLREAGYIIVKKPSEYQDNK